MIVEYVRYRIEQPDRAAFEDAYRAAAAALEHSPACLGYELSQCHEAAAHYVLRIEWRSLAGHLEGFRASAEFQDFLRHVRPYIDRIEEMRHYQLTAIRASRSVYDRLGGAAFFRLARQMHHEMQHDALLGGMFAHAAATHVPHLGMWLTEVFGGPPLYSATLDDIGPMLARHAGLDITDAQRDAFLACARRAIDAIVPTEEPEARAALLDYVTWGVQVAVENSRTGHVSDVNAGVPRWE